MNFMIKLMIFSLISLKIESAARIDFIMPPPPSSLADRPEFERTSSGGMYRTFRVGGGVGSIRDNPQSFQEFLKAAYENDLVKIEDLILHDKLRNREGSYFFTRLINTSDQEGDTVLMKAVIIGNINLVKLLLDQDADINIRNFKGQSALDLANKNYQKEIAQLISTKKKENSQPSASVTQKSSELVDAVRQNDFELAQRLIDIGANINSTYNILDCLDAGNQILDKAPTIEMFKFLVDNGANINYATGRGSAYETTLMAEIRKLNPEKVKILIQAGANLDAEHEDDQRPLDKAREIRSIFEQQVRDGEMKPDDERLIKIQRIIDLLKAEPKRRLNEQKKIYEQELQVTNLPKALSDIVIDYAEEPISYNELVNQKRRLAQKKRQEKISKALASTFPPGVTNIISGYLDESYADIPEIEK